MRQFLVTHLLTGERTLINARADAAYTTVAHQAGYEYLVDCTVSLVRAGGEIPLPFDVLPLIIRRARAETSAAA